MHQVYVDLIISVLLEQFETEQNFLENYLLMNEEDWQGWKRGERNLSSEAMQKVKNLFTDYEWMLTQKILRQTIIFPEKRTVAIAEYKQIKTRIAQKWLSSGCASVELIPLKNEQSPAGYLDLKVSIQYDEWGYDDILNFRLPAEIQRQIEGEKLELLDWVNENLEETYVHETMEREGK
ncbi:hypothetical protein A5844_000291 [Enterococcus sp. 10A9_DIV0425]|uniref:Uncharacterized protein n=1 Tax=Candidatus Enterococcus wittei TaxID=1987383 RepID=A0A2C9XRN6_9ENTE|nr:hypothetical protein [Enterococcus sp. 10A9_DIV0425]OTP12076.1 hypothetical protein A5844_000291 [Enterococcus sp. 10A9_DIV0425]THE10308.1 hypothetical protein E1H99_09705 [Enterococcus hirae]